MQSLSTLLEREEAERDAALAGEARDEARVSGIGAVEEEHAPALDQQPRQKVMAEPRRLARAVKEREAASRQPPRPRGRNRRNGLSQN